MAAENLDAVLPEKIPYVSSFSQSECIQNQRMTSLAGQRRGTNWEDVR